MTLSESTTKNLPFRSIDFNSEISNNLCGNSSEVLYWHSINLKPSLLCSLCLIICCVIAALKSEVVEEIRDLAGSQVK